MSSLTRDRIRARELIAEGKADIALDVLKAHMAPPSMSGRWARNMIRAFLKMGVPQVEIGVNPYTYELLPTFTREQLAGSIRFHALHMDFSDLARVLGTTLFLARERAARITVREEGDRLVMSGPVRIERKRHVAVRDGRPVARSTERLLEVERP